MERLGEWVLAARIALNRWASVGCIACAAGILLVAAIGWLFAHSSGWAGLGLLSSLGGLALWLDRGREDRWEPAVLLACVLLIQAELYLFPIVEEIRFGQMPSPHDAAFYRAHAWLGVALLAFLVALVRAWRNPKRRGRGLATVGLLLCPAQALLVFAVQAMLDSQGREVDLSLPSSRWSVRDEVNPREWVPNLNVDGAGRIVCARMLLHDPERSELSDVESQLSRFAGRMRRAQDPLTGRLLPSDTLRLRIDRNAPLDSPRFLLHALDSELGIHRLKIAAEGSPRREVGVWYLRLGVEEKRDDCVLAEPAWHAGPKDAVVAVPREGTFADVVEAIDAARDAGASRVALSVE